MATQGDQIKMQFKVHLKIQNDVKNGTLNYLKSNIAENWSVERLFSFLCFCWRADPRSARTGKVETQLLFFGVLSEIALFLCLFWKHFWSQRLPSFIKLYS